MQLTLFVVEGCPACNRAKVKVREVVAGFDDVKLSIKDLNEEKIENVQIVPALFIENKLFLYGEVDRQKLLQQIYMRLRN